MTGLGKRNLVRIKRSMEPVLLPEKASSTNLQAAMAPRLPSLEGATIGFYNNRKPFAANALPTVEKLLRGRGVADIFVGWGTSSNKPPQETLSSLSKADAVVLAGAD